MGDCVGVGMGAAEWDGFEGWGFVRGCGELCKRYTEDLCGGDCVGRDRGNDGKCVYIRMEAEVL